MPRSLADRFVLAPTQEPIETGEKRRRVINSNGNSLEVWTTRTGPDSQAAAQLFVLKFAGKKGRAERATDHPAENWPEVPMEIWAVNPPGYGGSAGPARLDALVAAAGSVMEDLERVAAGRPILLIGNSLGAATALYLGANYGVAGMVLRNPPPLKQLIVGRFGWWNLWLPAMAVAQGVPPELDCVRNAAACRAPAIFITSARDRLVPPRLQRQVLDAYAGEKQVVVLNEGDHASPMSAAELEEYEQHLRSIVDRLLG